MLLSTESLNFYSLFLHGFFRYKIVSTDCGNYYYFLRPSGNQIFLVCFLCRKLHQQFEMYKDGTPFQYGFLKETNVNAGQVTMETLRREGHGSVS